jgi:hypothetical protein
VLTERRLNDEEEAEEIKTSSTLSRALFQLSICLLSLRLSHPHKNRLDYYAAPEAALVLAISPVSLIPTFDSTSSSQLSSSVLKGGTIKCVLSTSSRDSGIARDLSKPSEKSFTSVDQNFFARVGSSLTAHHARTEL